MAYTPIYQDGARFDADAPLPSRITILSDGTAEAARAFDESRPLNSIPMGIAVYEWDAPEEGVVTLRITLFADRRQFEG